MIYIFGNCQGESLDREFKKLGISSCARWLANGETIGSNFNLVSQTDDLIKRLKLQQVLNGRDLYVQRDLFYNHDTPSAIVITLFHEEAPIWKHKSFDGKIYVDHRALQHPDLGRYLNEEFIIHEPSNSYFDRWEKVYKCAREKFPETPIFVIVRLSNKFFEKPIYSHSYLENWMATEDEFMMALKFLGDKDSNLFILQLSNTIRSLIEGGCDPDFFAPYLRNGDSKSVFLSFCRRNESYNTLIRDIEHLPPAIWESIAKTILEMIGAPINKKLIIPGSAHEGGSNSWDLTAKNLATSSCPFQLAYVIHRELKNPTLRNWDFMFQSGSTCPPAKYVLSMLKILKSNGGKKRVCSWVKGHRQFQLKAIRNLGDNFSDRYLKTLRELA